MTDSPTSRMHAGWKESMQEAKLGARQAQQDLRKQYSLDQWSIFQVEAYNLLRSTGIHSTTSAVDSTTSIYLPIGLEGLVSSFLLKQIDATDATVGGCPILRLHLWSGEVWLAFLRTDNEIQPLFNERTLHAYGEENSLVDSADATDLCGDLTIAVARK